jgi:ribosomal protein S27E
MGATAQDFAQARDFRFRDRRSAENRPLPRYVEQEFEAYLKCGLLEHGFLRVQCESCQAEKLVAFSCKGRAFCPSCGGRRMAETAALLVDEVLPRVPVRCPIDRAALRTTFRHSTPGSPPNDRHKQGV